MVLEIVLPVVEEMSIDNKTGYFRRYVLWCFMAVETNSNGSFFSGSSVNANVACGRGLLEFVMGI
jgi:hypothetical protein